MVQVKAQSVSFRLFVCLGLAYLANAQLLCSPINIDDLGNATDFSTDGLISSAVPPAGETANSVPVRILDYRIVCDASGINRNTSSSVSVLVRFQCIFNSGTGSLADCDGTTMLTRQYQFRCGPQNLWVDALNDLFVQTLIPNATFTTPLDNQCRRCVDDLQPSNSDPTTHCDSCRAGCDQGQMRCYIAQSGDQCCNFYLNNTCVAECPDPLVGDSNFDCVPIQCPDLSIENGKVITLPTDRSVNSSAEYSCNGGYKLDKGDAKRTCQVDGTWSGTDPECSKIIRTTTTTLSPGAIVGIVLAVVVTTALLILAVIIITAVLLKKKNNKV